MPLSNDILEEMENTAVGVIPGDELSLARFMRECSPERIRALFENLIDKKTIDELEDAISSLREENEELEYEKNEAESDTYKLEKDVSRLEQENERLQSEINELQQQIDTLESDKS